MREKGGYVCENTFIVHPPPSPGVHLTLLLFKLKYAHNNQILIKCRFYRTNFVKKKPLQPSLIILLRIWKP